MRTVDERQWAWLERALARGRGKFMMAIVGHPRFAGGYDTLPAADSRDDGIPEGLGALYRLLAIHNVRIAMAGDTHDFEYYRERSDADEAAPVTHHFVNGGGGAYLSIGTALDFPKSPAGRGLGVLSEDRPPARQNGRRDATLEAAVLVLD